MNLLPVGHCHQSAAGLCQAPVTKQKTCFAAGGPPFQPTTGLSKFSGGNPATCCVLLYLNGTVNLFVRTVFLDSLHETVFWYWRMYPKTSLTRFKSYIRFWHLLHCTRNIVQQIHWAVLDITFFCLDLLVLKVNLPALKCFTDMSLVFS